MPRGQQHKSRSIDPLAIFCKLIFSYRSKTFNTPHKRPRREAPRTDLSWQRQQETADSWTVEQSVWGKLGNGSSIYLFDNLQKAGAQAARQGQKATKKQINILFHKIQNKMKSFSKEKGNGKRVAVGTNPTVTKSHKHDMSQHNTKFPGSLSICASLALTLQLCLSHCLG